MNIELISRTDPPTFGTQPYYLIAYEPGGLSVAKFVGTDHNNLTWQVKFAAGQLLYELNDTAAANAYLNV